MGVLQWLTDSVTLTTADLIGFNGQVDIERRSPNEVARPYLQDTGLQEGPGADGVGWP